MVRRKLKLIKKQLAGMLICLVFSSCSLTGIWWYQSIDSYLESYFLEYAEFTDKQEAYIGKATKEFKKWHKIDQLPKLKKLLLELKDMENYRTLQEIELLYNKIFSLFIESNNFFHPYLITISKNLSDNQIKDIKKQNPEIIVLSHPECPAEVIAESDFTGSTSGMSNYVKKNQPKKVMLVTECSMSDNVQVDNPNVQFIKPCNLCPYMKMISLPKVLECLEKETNEIFIPGIIIKKAQKAVERMVAVGRSH